MTARAWPGDALQAEVSRLESEEQLAIARVRDAEKDLSAAELHREEVGAVLLRARNELKGGPQ